MVTTVGLLSPGAMAAAVGAILAAAGVEVRVAGHGRSDASRQRADEAGLVDAGALPDLLADVEVVLSICPPHAALEVADAVAVSGFAGIYLDANAVAPATATRIAERVGRTAAVVDGGIIGVPPREPGTTRLYLAGEQAPTLAALFPPEPLGVHVLDAPTPAASALKVAYAAWTKGSAALLLAVRAFATASGVDHDLLTEWARSQPDLAERSERVAAGSAPKAWRFVGEMEQIAASFDAAGLPTGFHDAAAGVYDRLSAGRESPSSERPAARSGDGPQDADGLATAVAALLGGAGQ